MSGDKRPERPTLTLIGGQGDVPVIKVITRREPPGKKHTAVLREVEEPEQDHEAAHAMMLVEARVAVQRTIQSYRWWGWTNIMLTIRLWLQARRFKRRNASYTGGDK